MSLWTVTTAGITTAGIWPRDISRARGARTDSRAADRVDRGHVRPGHLESCWRHQAIFSAVVVGFGPPAGAGFALPEEALAADFFVAETSSARSSEA